MQEDENVRAEPGQQRLRHSPPRFTEAADVYFYGEDEGRGAPQVPLTPDLLSHHVLFLGSPGTGKTTALLQVARQIIDAMTQDDVMLIFDPKGDYLDLRREGDVVINAFTPVDGVADYWNIYREIGEGDDPPEKEEAEINEIALTLFEDRLKHSREVFFPNAAKDLLAGIMTAQYRENARGSSNQSLRSYLDSASRQSITQLLSAYSDLSGLSSYISGDHPQTQGVVSELQQVNRTLFQGNFKRKGSLSVRRLVRERGKKVIFIEYDLRYGFLLEPVYKLLFDLALKEALSQEKRPGNVYFMLDEYRLLPNSAHLEIAANFGRTFGVKMLLGLQSVSQLYALYPSAAYAESLLSGLATHVVFRLNDAASRDYVSRRLGKNQKLRSYMPMVSTRGRQDALLDGYVVEDWDILRLKKGQTIVALPETEPFRFDFAEAWGAERGQPGK
jgi:type IV secretory pathway TraG/TraD family ATPase VirD4